MYILKMPVNGIDYYYEACSYAGCDYVYMTRDINKAKLLETQEFDFVAYDCFTSDDGLVSIQSEISKLEAVYEAEGLKDYEIIKKIAKDMGWTFEVCQRATAIEPTSYVLMAIINSMTMYYQDMEYVEYNPEISPEAKHIHFTLDINKAKIFSSEGTLTFTFIDTNIESNDKLDVNGFMGNSRYRGNYSTYDKQFDAKITEDLIRKYFDVKRVPVHRATMVIKNEGADI